MCGGSLARGWIVDFVSSACVARDADETLRCATKNQLAFAEEGTMAASSFRPSNRKHNKNDSATTEAIAKDTETDIERVEEIYEQELNDLASEAKITQYLGVLAGRRVRMKLRKH
jgi:hypothetical protein